MSTTPDTTTPAPPFAAPSPFGWLNTPGTEYPFSISDIAWAVSRLLGDGWSAESGPWGTTGVVSGPTICSFVFLVDYDGELCIENAKYEDDAFPEHPALPDGVREYADGVYLELATASDGLDVVAERSAAAIRAVTGS